MTLEPSPNEPFTVEMNRYGKELYKFSVREFKKFLGPGVYVARTETEFLYVGSSNNIFGRTSTRSHEALRAALAIEGCKIWILIASSERQAREMEAYLIAENQPRFNKTGKSRNSGTYKHIQEWYPEFEQGGLAAIVKAENG
jgi:excinuclease UvrABC nuclease subunit